MSRDTKSRILEVSLELFSRNGYAGTSMNDIAKELGVGKSALYKHYISKHDILECIVEYMREKDSEYASKFDMPLYLPDRKKQESINTTYESIKNFTLAQFRHWTEEKMPSQFRKMLTMEKYHSEEMAVLYRDYIELGPVEYMSAIFSYFTSSGKEAMFLAMEYYGPMYLLYSVYDRETDKNHAFLLLNDHIEHFFENHNMNSKNI